jgi:GNAT superfamily N-acetyltransferase
VQDPQNSIASPLEPERCHPARRTWQAESVPDALLKTIETFYDAVPRPLSDAHERGPLTLFASRVGWPYYARPTPGASQVDESDVRAVLALAEELDVPRTLEWVHETTPSLAEAARAAGLQVREMPLLVLEDQVADVPAAAVQVDMLGADDPRLADAWASVHAGFGGTDEKEPEPVAPWLADVIRDGLMCVAGAFATDGAAVGGGSYQTRGSVCELVGIATLPSWRGKGVGAAITRRLAEDATSRGVTTVFLSAGDDTVARVYERVGFRRVATACTAEPA